MAITHPESLFDEIIEFLASTPTANELIAVQPPDHLQRRLSELLSKNRSGDLSSEDQLELDEFLRMNRFMSRLKLKARQKLDET